MSLEPLEPSEPVTETDKRGPDGQNFGSLLLKYVFRFLTRLTNQGSLPVPVLTNRSSLWFHNLLQLLSDWLFLSLILFM